MIEQCIQYLTMNDKITTTTKKSGGIWIYIIVSDKPREEKKIDHVDFIFIQRKPYL